MLRVRNPLWAILLLSLGLKLAVWGALVAEDPLAWADSDMREYQGSARALLESGAFAPSPRTPDVPETFRTPGYPAFLAAIYWVFGVRPAAAVLAQIFVSLGTIAITYSTACALWTPHIASLAALLLALDVVSLSYAELLLSETVFTFLLAAMTACGVRLLRADRKPKLAVGVGTLLGLATLVRPISYYLAPPLAFGFLAWGTIDRWSWRPRLAASGLLLVPFVLIVGSWQLRNYARTGTAEFSRVMGENLLVRAAGVEGLRTGTGARAAHSRLRAEESSNPTTSGITEQSAQRGEKSLAIFASHPLLFLRAALTNAVGMLCGPGEHPLVRFVDKSMVDTPGLDLHRLPFADFWRKWVSQPRWPLAIFLFAFVYLAVIDIATLRWLARNLLERRIRGADLFLWGITGYFLVASFASSRFRCPIMPILAMYAAAGLSCRKRPV